MEIKSADAIESRLNRNKKTVIVSGVSGQDGSLMADFLLKETDFNIVGGARRLSVENHLNLKHLAGVPNFHLVNFDLTDTHSIDKIMYSIRPDYFINLAAQSFVKSSWDFPVQTWEANTTSVLHILEAVRQYCPECRIYNAGSSEEMGDVIYSPQDENHPIRPRSPYGASKAAARQLIKVYRESYNLFAIQAWLFNHEGPRRGMEFVTRKVSNKVVEIYNCMCNGTPPTPLELGNLDAMRDWSDAEDCVRAIWMMLNNTVPREYVVSSGESHSIREFVELAFGHLKITGNWVNKGVDEVFIATGGPGLEESSPKPVLVKINPELYRPAEVQQLCGNSVKIRTELGWKPTTSFSALVRKMVQHDLSLAQI